MLNSKEDYHDQPETEKVTMPEDYQDRLRKFLDEEGERIRKEADRESLPIVLKAKEAYKQRLSQFLEEESERIKKEQDQESIPIIVKAREAYKERLKKFLEEEGERIRKQTEQEAIAQVKREADAILLECRQKMIPLLEKEREQIIQDAKQESSIIIDQANKESEDIMNVARNSAEEIMAEARKQATEMKEQMVADIKENLWNELEKSVLLVVGAQQKLGLVIKAAEIEAENLGQPKGIVPEINTFNAAAAELTHGDVSVEREDEGNYKGNLELEILRPVDKTQEFDPDEDAILGDQRTSHWQRLQRHWKGQGKP